MNNTYLPEGLLSATPQNREYISSLSGLERAMNEGKILESTVILCDSQFRLHVDLYGIKGIIERDEVLYNHDDADIKDIAIITRVGKPVCFKVISIEYRSGKPVAILSRRAAQLECTHKFIDKLSCGDIIKARISHLENFGAFVDIGCGITSLLSVDSISVSRISHPSDRLNVGQYVYTVVKSKEAEKGRIFVSMRELLGTWEENAAQFKSGETVAGIIRSVEDYGIFVELAPNLAGLAEIREGSREKLKENIGRYAAVYIKSIIPERMKIKLVLIDSYKGDPPDKEFKYFIDVENVSHIDSWKYSPSTSSKSIETVFDNF